MGRRKAKKIPKIHENPIDFNTFFDHMKNLCSGPRTVHIFNQCLHGFLLLDVFAKKHMKTQLVLTILNLHLFSYLWFPNISKTLLSHVCSDIGDERLFCFTSAARMLGVLLVRWFPYPEAIVFVKYCKTPAALTTLLALFFFCSFFPMHNVLYKCTQTPFFLMSWSNKYVFLESLEISKTWVKPI